MMIYEAIVDVLCWSITDVVPFMNGRGPNASLQILIHVVKSLTSETIETHAVRVMSMNKNHCSVILLQSISHDTCLI